MSIQQITGLYYAPSAHHGRGVFCREQVSKGDVIEIAPVLVMPPEASAWIGNSPLYHYYFQWGQDGDAYALAWGYASLYNHGDPPNAEFIPDFGLDLITFRALTTIVAGVEITIDYHAGLRDGRLWFEPR